MNELGGPTTQSGIQYQNSIAALYLGRMCDATWRPENETITEVRSEAPEKVDDILVLFADGHRAYIQVKENITSSSNEWKKLWCDFAAQYLKETFQRNRDRLLLVTGSLCKECTLLKGVCDRASTSKTYEEWSKRLNKSQKAFLEKIKPLFSIEFRQLLEPVRKLGRKPFEHNVK